MSFQAVKNHFAGHGWHMAGCVFAVVLVVIAGIAGLPILAALGGLLCASMMIGMVWMMLSMGRKHDG